MLISITKKFGDSVTGALVYVLCVLACVRVCVCVCVCVCVHEA